MTKRQEAMLRMNEPNEQGENAAMWLYIDAMTDKHFSNNDLSKLGLSFESHYNRTGQEIFIKYAALSYFCAKDRVRFSSVANLAFSSIEILAMLRTIDWE